MKKNTFKKLVKNVNDLNTKMHDAILAFLKEHNGLVRTDTYNKENKGKMLSPIYVISMQADDEPNTEHRVLAVATFGNEVAVLPALGENDYLKETLEGMTDQEVLDLDNWEWINNGYVLQNATLLSICEGIEEYV